MECQGEPGVPGEPTRVRSAPGVFPGPIRGRRRTDEKVIVRKQSHLNVARASFSRVRTGDLADNNWRIRGGIILPAETANSGTTASILCSKLAADSNALLSLVPKDLSGIWK